MLGRCSIVIFTWLGCARCGVEPVPLSAQLDPRHDDAVRQNIVRGTPSGEQLFGQVGTLVATNASGKAISTCTGTLLAPDLVLTAAHCIPEPDSGPNTWQMWFSTAADARRLARLQPKRITHTFVHPLFDPKNSLQAPLAWRTATDATEAEALALLHTLCGPNTTLLTEPLFWQCVAGLEPELLRRLGLMDSPMNAADVGLVLLDTPLVDAPLACLPTAAMAPLQPGAQLIAVGYGTTDATAPQGTNGVRRFGNVRLDGVGQYELQGGFAEAQICSGDSGGPLLAAQESAYAVVGVASRSLVNDAGDCRGPTLYARAQAFAPWVRQVVRQACREHIRSAQMCRDFPL